MTSKPGFTNVSVQKFASEGDLALFERNLSEHRELVLGKLGEKGLETAIFGGIAMKVTAYRGVTVESWKRD